MFKVDNEQDRQIEADMEYIEKLSLAECEALYIDSLKGLWPDEPLYMPMGEADYLRRYLRRYGRKLSSGRIILYDHMRRVQVTEGHANSFSVNEIAEYTNRPPATAIKGYIKPLVEMGLFSVEGKGQSMTVHTEKATLESVEG